jgi:hypothetical protein
MTPQLSKEFKIGKQTPPKQFLTISSGDVPLQDLDLLRVAVMDTGPGADVDLSTEYGIWTFKVMGSNVGDGLSTFSLESHGPPRQE